jgi:hypothetical protein
MMSRARSVSMIIGAVGATLALGHAAGAQTDVITREVIAKAVASIAERVETNYVVADTGRMIADHVRKRLATGAYDKLQTRAQFVDRVTADLRSLNGDPHLFVRSVAGPGTAGGGIGSGPQMVMRGGGGSAPSPEALDQARRDNFGVRRAERLAGNVGYLDLALVSRRGTEEAYQAVDAAMAVLEHADAMIIDLRNTPGGDPAMSDYVASYFFGPDSIRTLTTSNRAPSFTMERWTVRVAGKRSPTIPLYVLIGPGTVSGAEDLAFIFRSTRRGTLVGERSAGAGRPNRLYPVDEGFMVSVSGGRTFDPRTGKEWERIGIEPDISAPGDDALFAAHVDVLKKLAGSAQDTTRRRSLDLARENLQARWHPRAMSAEVLARLAGEYDTRRVILEGRKLYYTREGMRARTELLAISDTLFALGEATQVEFVHEGNRVTGVRFLTPDGQVAVLPRTK